jgi:hypothetical protein
MIRASIRIAISSRYYASAMGLAGRMVFAVMFLGVWAWALPGTVHGAQATESVVGAERSAFLQTLEDVPLMPGLAERAGEGVVFETSVGRIIEAVASSSPAGGLTGSRVIDFYRTTLAALGWRVIGPGRFAREGEILVISTGAGGQALEVRFSLRPK